MDVGLVDVDVGLVDDVGPVDYDVGLVDVMLG